MHKNLRWLQKYPNHLPLMYAQCGMRVGFKPLHAKFFRGSINVYLHFISFLHTDQAQMVEIISRVKQGRA